MTMASELNYKKIVTTMNYCVGTTNQGSFLMPARKQDTKDNTSEFLILGWSDSNYAKNPENWKSILGTRVFLDGCSIIFCSGT